MATVKGQIPVRGTCKDGHVTEATSDRGRVTWEGPCAHDGCELKVKARRIPGATPPASEPAQKAPDKPAGEDDPHRVIEVEFDRDDPAPGPRAGGADNEPSGEGEGTPARVAEAGAAGGDEPEPPARQPRRGNGRWRRGRPRLSRAERADARRRAAEQWVIPNVLPR